MAHATLAAGARRLVATSTWNTYGVGRPEISEESDQRGGASEISYMRTKHLTEEELRAVGRKGLDVVTVDPGHVSGRYHTRNWGRIIRMVGRHACPACRACAAPSAMVPRWRPRTSPPPSAAGPAATTCCRGVEASFAEVISLAAELLGRPIPTRTIPTWLLTRMARAKVLRAAITGQEPDLTPDSVALMANDPRITSDRARRELRYAVASLVPNSRRITGGTSRAHDNLQTK